MPLTSYNEVHQQYVKWQPFGGNIVTTTAVLARQAYNVKNFNWFTCISHSIWAVDHGPLARYVKLRVRMRRECRERFPRHRRWAIPTCITARASRTCRDACRDRQLSVSFEIGGGGKRSRHSRRMRNLQFYVSGKRPIVRWTLARQCNYCDWYSTRDGQGPVSI